MAANDLFNNKYGFVKSLVCVHECHTELSLV